MAVYKNSFHKDFDSSSGPIDFVTDAEPIIHGGFEIYRREQKVWDIVSDGVCIGIYAGLEGAKRAIGTRFSQVAA